MLKDQFNNKARTKSPSMLSWIEQVYATEVAAGQIRIDPIRHDIRHIIVSLILGGMVVYGWQYQWLPWLDQAQQHCQQWHGIDPTLLMLWIAFVFIPIAFGFYVMLYEVSQQIHRLNASREVRVRDRRFPRYRIYRTLTSVECKQHIQKRYGLMGLTLALLVIYIVFVVPSHFFGIASIKDMRNPLNLAHNSKIVHQRCIAKLFDRTRNAHQR